jgi:hypothetical protein
MSSEPGADQRSRTVPPGNNRRSCCCRGGSVFASGKRACRPRSGRGRFGLQAEQCIELLLAAVQHLGRLNDQVCSEAELAEQLDCLA